MRFLVHIGDGKCGSTAIQNSLYRSREELARHGVLFDTLAPNSGHVVLPILLGLNSRALSEKRRQLAQDTVQLLRDKAADFDCMVLSAENLINLDPALLTDLLDMLATGPHSVEVIAYVRGPVAMYLSSIQQILKGSHFYPRPEKPGRRVDRKLAAWRDRVGADATTVRLFDRAALQDGDVIADFEGWLAHRTGRPITLERLRSNDSMTAEQMRVMQLFRATAFPDCPGEIRDRSTGLARLFGDLNQCGQCGNRPRLTDMASAVVAQANREIVDNLNRQFPQLGMPAAAPDGLCAEAPQPPYPWSAGDDVGLVLRDLDGDLVNRIALLVPDLNQGQVLQGAELDAALAQVFRSDVDLPAARAAYARYTRYLARCQPLSAVAEQDSTQPDSIRPVTARAGA